MDQQTSTGAEDEMSPFRADMTLVARSLTGDDGAERDLIERLRCVPRFLAAKNAQMGRIFDDAELEDLAQDTVLSIWRKRSQYTGTCTLETWIFPFCYHHLMNRLRRRTSGIPTVGAEAANAVAARKETNWDHVYTALEQLDEEEAAAVRMKHFEDLPFVQIGPLLGIPVSTAKTRYYRGIERLRTLLDQHGGDMD